MDNQNHRNKTPIQSPESSLGLGFWFMRFWIQQRLKGESKRKKNQAWDATEAVAGAEATVLWDASTMTTLVTTDSGNAAALRRLLLVFSFAISLWAPGFFIFVWNIFHQYEFYIIYILYTKCRVCAFIFLYFYFWVIFVVFFWCFCFCLIWLIFWIFSH